MGDAGTDSHGRGAVTFTTMENFMSGSVSSAGAQLLIGNPRRHVTDNWMAGFFQDDWRVAPRIIVNLGIRYEYVTAYKEEFNRLANFDPTAGVEQVGNQIAPALEPQTQTISVPKRDWHGTSRGTAKPCFGGGSIMYVTPPM